MTGNGNAAGPDRDPTEMAVAVHRGLQRSEPAETLASPLWEERGTSVADVEAQLARIWQSEAADSTEAVVLPKGLAHARASVLNLIVTVSGAAEAERVVGTMLGLGMRHPSRALVLVADPRAQGDPLDARIAVHCHNAGDSGDRVCYEEVVLSVRGEAAEHLAGIVAPLLIHDLPTHVWWPGDPPFGDPVFRQLVDFADRLIVDSGDFDDLLAGFRRLMHLRDRCAIGDLGWERLSWWQELTAQFFDAPRFRRYLANLNRMRIRYALPPGRATGGSPINQAALYAGWLASRLEWQRSSVPEPPGPGGMHLLLEGRYEMVELLIEPESTDEIPPGELTGLSLRAHGETGAAEFIVDRHADEATVATNADGMTALLRRVRMMPAVEAELLAQQLVVERGDPVYEAALQTASHLLEASVSAVRR